MNLDHLIDILDQNPFLGAASATPQQTTLCTYAPPTQAELMHARLEPFNVDMPFTAFDKRRIVENMTFNEALMAVKASDRLSALQMLGKMESINVFAAEKKVVEISDAAILKERIQARLATLLDGAVDAEVIE